MSKVYVFSDPHFGHTNMAKKRGFNDSHHHDEMIIEKWNAIITKRDVVHILGDITMEKNRYDILKRLNGIKKVVLGNHDQPAHVKELLKYVNTVAGMVKMRVDGKKLFLTHCPIHPEEVKRVDFNIHGHVHEKTIYDSRYINVSAENIDYTPQLISELINGRTTSKRAKEVK